MVMPPHRDGGQAQYVASPIAPHPSAGESSMNALLSELLGELDGQHTIEALARRVHQSPRSFARHFRAETGTTPYAWLLRQRVLAAQALLEGGDETLDLVARRCGFGTAIVMRHHFSRIVGTAPAAYRRTFRVPQRSGRTASDSCPDSRTARHRRRSGRAAVGWKGCRRSSYAPDGLSARRTTELPTRTR